MVRRICPVCDQVMITPHYCAVCKRIVKEPWVRDVDYYLNEGHPYSERDCSFHGGMGQAARRTADTGQAPYTRQMSPGKERKRKLSAKKVVLVILAVYAGFQLLALCLSLIGAAAIGFLAGLPGDEAKYEEEYDVDLGAYMEGDRCYLEDEEVIRAGKACTAMGHFDIRGADLQSDLRRILEKQGFEIREVDRMTYNERQEGGDSWYESYISFQLGSVEDEEIYENVDIGSDTATGQLHEIDIYLIDREKTAAVAEAVLEMLDEHASISKGADLGLIMADLEKTLEADGEMHTDYGTVAVSAFRHDYGYIVYISRE